MADDDSSEMEHGLPDSLFQEGAKGSMDAFRQLRDNALHILRSGRIPLNQALTAAEVFARFAATSGDEKDAHILASILFWRASMLALDEYDANYSLAEGMIAIERSADAGSEQSAQTLNWVVEQGLPKPALDLARRWSRMLKAQEAQARG